MNGLVAALMATAALLIARALTPHTIPLAYRIGALDVPGGERRLHSRVTPRVGGLALFVSFLLCGAWLSRLPLGRDVPTPELLALLWGATLLVFLGLLDDVFRLRAPLKLTVQLLAAAVALGNGGGWEQVALGEWILSLGALRFPLGVLWITVMINAHNMIDGLDGLAASVSAVEAGTLATVLALGGKMGACCLALIVLGACLGYLPYNRHPARVFMGDTGSQLLGFVLGVLALRVDVGAVGTLGVAVPLLLFALPLSDLIFAAVRRTLRGQSVFQADRGHWHHRLTDAGLGQRQVCAWLSLLGAALGAVAILLCREDWYGFAVYATLGAISLVLLLETRLWRRRMNKKRG